MTPMRKTITNVVLVLLTFSSAILPGWPGVAHAEQETVPPPLVISEVQTTGLSESGIEDGAKEFVEVYNPSSLPLDANGWRVEYLSASNNGSGAPTRVLGELNVIVGGASYLLLSYADYLPDADMHFGTSTPSSTGWIAKSGGHIRIVNAAGQTIDLVTWGSGVPVQTDPPMAWWRASSIPAGTSIQRLGPSDSGYVNGLEFTAPGVPTPYGGNAPLPPSEPPACAQLVLSEVLPNPAGADNGREFIEIHNPTNTAISMRGCSLRFGEAGRQFALPDELLLPDGFRAFYDAETNITLPNATAQSVWLLADSQERSALYQNDMKDDQSWSLIGDTWQVGLPTPGRSNLSLPMGDSSVFPKGEPKSKTVAAPVTCPVGKERNPATNRCRSIVATASAPVPCKSGQERNPQTNRCRSVLSSQTKQKPCPEGQERNAATNRCRKKPGVGAASLAQVQDVNSLSSGAHIRWWAAGLVAAGAAGYAAYEWRRDIGNIIHRVKIKHGGRK
jgi:hypothetical protein